MNRRDFLKTAAVALAALKALVWLGKENTEPQPLDVTSSVERSDLHYSIPYGAYAFKVDRGFEMGQAVTVTDSGMLAVADSNDSTFGYIIQQDGDTAIAAIPFRAAEDRSYKVKGGSRAIDAVRDSFRTETNAKR
jgi:hypothetical protein